METLLVALVWALCCAAVCVFIHGAKKARRTRSWVDEARRNVKWPARTE
ncbi:hypothetical protein [Caballeronia telluris]|uniref:Uncharacterized protein n=1 Tax=Caballeronia telluris TaxID=326475 RepID=A0A158G275_9BURK|nr:hypothetical protein [Caballeronia telluris]SAL26204.1 hypothetical protein AWB66_01519 [Caballeronia telluris]